MASYFELSAGFNAPATVDVPKEEREELRGTSLLSPQVSRMLDALQLDDESSSSDEEEDANSSSSKSDGGPRLPDENTKVNDSLSRKSRQGNSGRTAGDKSLKNPRSHMARFQSLRSTLFQANIESNMMQRHQEAEAREKAATDWKAQHEKRQCYSRPLEVAPNERDGLGRRISMKTRRLTNKEPQTTANIEEKTVNMSRRESTASDDEIEPHSDIWKPRQSYESSIDHSDVDELVRWVSRRDPPSDGERRMSNIKESKKEDSGHESLGHSDIEELVHHASRKSISLGPVMPIHTGYSDESTASDSEHSQEDHDVIEDSLESNLSRWVSRRDGVMAGPVRKQGGAFQINPATEADDSDVPEIGRWRTHHDNTSGESIVGSSEVAKKDDVSVLEAKRGRSRERSPHFEDKDHIKDIDVDELVRWVSRRGSKHTSNPGIKDELAGLQSQEEKQKQLSGMTVDDESPEALDDLTAHIRGRDTSGFSLGTTPARV